MFILFEILYVCVFLVVPDWMDWCVLESHSDVGNASTGKQAIMHFEDLDPGYAAVIASERDSTFDAVQSEDAKLGDFLSRPVRIKDERWTSTAPSAINMTFNPWTLYCEDSAVAEKLKYFNNMSGKLHVKFIINGNAFLYGRVMVTYEPLPFLNTLDIANLLEEDYVLLSQRPKIFLNPTTNEGGEMELPFFWTGNYLDVTERDWDRMGEITLSSLNPLRHASGETQSVTITVYAYMTDVTLATPTALQSQCELISHAKKTSVTKKDEYGTGIVSKPATAVAAAAGWMTDMPVIGPYARATQMVAGAIGESAKMFGYSRPPEIGGTKPVKTVMASSFATTDQPDNVLKLTLDSKAETTIDARTVGLSSDDHMGIYDIAQKESYLTQFKWVTYEVGDVPGTILFTSNVTPTLSNNTLNGGIINMTPMAMMSQLFSYWHGSVTFRFQIVASNFHKGRLRIQYDPNEHSSLDENKQYTEIIDIAETRDFELTVGWGQAVPFLDIAQCGQNINGAGIYNEFESGPVPLSRQSNGQITVSVLNELTVPGDPGTIITAPPIEINVFVKAGDDMKFAVPRSDLIENLAVTPIRLVSQSELVSHSEVTTDATTNKSSMENKPEETMRMQMNPESRSGTNHLMEVFFGEHTTSLRQLFRRYCFHTAWELNPAAANECRTTTIKNKAFPFYRASFSTNVGVKSYTTGPSDYSVNPCVTIPLTYCCPAFVGFRGSIRRKLVNNVETGGNMRVTTVYRSPYEPEIPSVSTRTYTDNIDFLIDGSSPFVNSSNGSELMLLRNNACLEFESPYYYPIRFSSTRLIKPEEIESEFYLASQFTQSGGAETGRKFTLDYVATGEDFTLFFFLNCPRYYRWDMPT
jgi:hypothetical protein